MATATGLTVADVGPGALAVARRYLSARTTDGEAGAEGTLDILRQLGAVLPGERLSQAGALVFCATDRTHLTLSVLDVEGGDVISRAVDLSGLSLLEQLAAVEQRLDAISTTITVRGSFAETPIRRLPPAALREAIVNGLVHRDWMQPEPVEVTCTTFAVLGVGGLLGCGKWLMRARVWWRRRNSDQRRTWSMPEAAARRVRASRRRISARDRRISGGGVSRPGSPGAGVLFPAGRG